MAHTHPLFIPSTFQISFAIPIPYIVPKISLSPRLCEIFRNAVSCYGVELLSTRPTNKLEDTLFGCLLLLIQYITNQLSHFEAICSIAT